MSLKRPPWSEWLTRAMESKVPSSVFFFLCPPWPASTPSRPATKNEKISLRGAMLREKERKREKSDGECQESEFNVSA